MIEWYAMATPSAPLMIPGEWEPRRASGTIHADTSRLAPEPALELPPLATLATKTDVKRPNWTSVSLFVGALLIATLVAMFGASVSNH